MATKENKGGFLRNEQIEKDLEVNGRQEAPAGYSGVQDNGDGGVRTMGSDVQQTDGGAMDKEDENQAESPA